MTIDVFQQELGRVLDEHAPIITKRLPRRQAKPWFSEDIKEKKQKVHRRERIWRQYMGNHQWLAFKSKNENTEKCLKRPK